MSNNFEAFELAVAHMTDYEMIDFATDLYVRKLNSINYEEIWDNDLPCDKEIEFEKLYSQ